MTVVARTASRIKKRENSFMLKLANASGSELGRKEARNHNRWQTSVWLCNIFISGLPTWLPGDAALHVVQSNGTKNPPVV